MITRREIVGIAFVIGILLSFYSYSRLVWIVDRSSTSDIQDGLVIITSSNSSMINKKSLLVDDTRKISESEKKVTVDAYNQTSIDVDGIVIDPSYSSSDLMLPKFISFDNIKGKKNCGILLLSAVLVPRDRRILIETMLSLPIKEMIEHEYATGMRNYSYHDDENKTFVPVRQTFFDGREIAVDIRRVGNKKVPFDRYKDCLYFPCQVAESLIIFIGNERYETESTCMDLGLGGARLLNRIGLGYYKLTDEIVEKIKIHSRNHNKIGIKLKQKQDSKMHESNKPDFEINLKTLSSGVMNNTVGYRKLPEPLDDDTAWDKNRLGMSQTMSVCIANIRSYTPYIKEIVQYFRNSGLSHVYLGIEHDYCKIKRRKIVNEYANALKDFEDKNFVTIVDVEHPNEVLIVRGKIYFLEPCYTHARHFDTFVAIHDADEMFIIRQPMIHGYNIPQYLMRLVATKNFTTYDVFDKHHPKWLPMPKNKLPQNPDINSYCQIMIAGAASRFKPIQPRTYILAKDFPTRKNYISYCKFDFHCFIEYL